MDDRILECIYGAVDEANLDRDGKPPLEKSPDTPIYGDADGLDSLGLINFVVAVEENVEAAFGVPVALSDDRALSLEPNPLRSIGSLASFVDELLREQGVDTGSSAESPAR